VILANAAVAFLVGALAFLVVFVAGGGLAAAKACGAAPVGRVRELRAALATPTVMATADERISGLGGSRNGPFGRRILKSFSPERTLVSPFTSLRVRIPARPGEE
jgi:hypothetical protein